MRTGLGLGVTYDVDAEFFSSYSLYFDGSDDYVDCGNDNSLDFGTGDFSVTLWHKSGAEQNQPFIGKKAVYDDNTAGWVIYMQNAPDVMRCRIGGGSSEVATSIEDAADSTLVADDNQWHHTVMVRSGDNLYLYFDGVLGPDGGAAGVNSLSVNNSEPLYIGRSASLYPAMFADEVALWNAALSEKDIKRIYNNGMPNNLLLPGVYATDRTSNLKGWWRFEEVSGTSVADSSGNGNTGTIYGASSGGGKQLPI
jgi:hypothetical protein